MGVFGRGSVLRRDGLAAALAAPPAVVFLDIGMGPMNGFEFATRLRAVPGCGRTPMFAISGHTSAAFQARARAVGIADYLLKPADPEVVRALLARLMPVREDAAVTPDTRRRRELLQPAVSRAT